jgi:3-oxoacyl-(acyl-carrier-protein) synthase
VPITRFPEEAGSFVAAEVKRFNISDYIDQNGAKRLPRHTQFALAATKLALADAALTQELIKVLEPIVITGTSLMDSAVVNKTIEDVTRKGPRFGLARVVFQGPVASIPFAVAELVGGARTLSLQSACCSGSDAIGHAAAMVANGESDLAICGGTEAPITRSSIVRLDPNARSDVADRTRRTLGRIPVKELRA